MMGIKKYISFLLITITFFSCKEDDLDAYNQLTEPFVRFDLKLDNNGMPFEFPSISNLTEPASEYTHRSLREVKIPIALSHANLTQEVDVVVSLTSQNLTEGQDYSLLNQDLIFSFNKDKLVDTIRILPSRRFNEDEVNQLSFEIEQVSDEEVNIGYPNTINPATKVDVTLRDTFTTIGFPQENNESISGQSGTEVFFDVLFENGLFKDELEDVDLFVENPGFDYTLAEFPFEDGDRKITYQLTLNETIEENELYIVSLFKLNQVDQYIQVGSSSYQVQIPLDVPREVSVNTAANFYDTSNQFYRTFGENWLDANDDGICAWSAFNQFTYPVEVNEDNEFAVLGEGSDTPGDTSDDVYYHAFQVRFGSPTPGNTTNSFNLKRWFNNESSNASVSPGFNFNPSLEFIPNDEGTSTTSGSVQVIPTFGTISGDGNSYCIGFQGEGTYQEVEPEIFQIQLTLRATNNELFWGTVEATYVIYNTSNFDEPDPLAESCFGPINL
ncbi:hypothetical protein GCM10009117_27070 [Gangjinia marincola]|uniref:DUF1735 domain-containing protein n=1 Tax=Gangjinia marincola TaxID=578463 RepID=A0ABP3XVV8_9FLAO